MQNKRDKFTKWTIAHVEGGYDNLLLEDLITILHLVTSLRAHIDKRSWALLGDTVEKLP